MHSHSDIFSERGGKNYILKRHRCSRRAAPARSSSLQPWGSAQPTVIDTLIQTLFSLAESKPVRKHTTKHVCHPRWALPGTTYISLSPPLLHPSPVFPIYIILSMYIRISISGFWEDVSIYNMSQKNISLSSYLLLVHFSLSAALQLKTLTESQCEMTCGFALKFPLWHVSLLHIKHVFYSDMHSLFRTNSSQWQNLSHTLSHSSF